MLVVISENSLQLRCYCDKVLGIFGTRAPAGLWVSEGCPILGSEGGVGEESLEDSGVWCALWLEWGSPVGGLGGVWLA